MPGLFGIVRLGSLQDVGGAASGTFEYLDRDVLADMLRQRAPRSEAARRKSTALSEGRLFARRSLERISPGLLMWVQRLRNTRPVFPLSATSILMRALVLKDWHDSVAGTARQERTL
jgi:hypothetical protein